MKELQFVARREAAWAAWERWLRTTSATGKPRKSKEIAPATPTPEEIAAGDALRANLPHEFRALCHDLALARDRQYSSLLQDRLRVLVLAAHQRIYSARKKEGLAIFRFILHGFPSLVRRERRVILLSAALLFIPFAIMLVALQYFPDGIYLLMSPDSVSDFDNMYSPTAKRLGAHAISGEWMMWGYYIRNNIGIDFQCFGSGMFFGIGSVFYMLYNGLSIGAVAGHLTQIGYIETFWSFVAGHSAFELTGAALAAFIEAFWSAERAFPVHLKYGVGIGMWFITLSYLLFAGKERNAA
jgi:uncharacterized membrane protein SpoIIM required for sporulation